MALIELAPEMTVEEITAKTEADFRVALSGVDTRGGNY